MKRQAQCGLIGGLLLIGLTGCGSVPSTVASQATVFSTAHPTVAPSAAVALAFLNGLPQQIGRFTMATNDPDPSQPQANYVALDNHTGTVVGAKVTYTLDGRQMVIALFLTGSVADAQDRFNRQAAYTTVPVVPLEIGDQALIAPTNRGIDDLLVFQPSIWGLLRFRNVVIDVYPTRSLTTAYDDFTAAELTTILQTVYDALPKP